MLSVEIERKTYEYYLAFIIEKTNQNLLFLLAIYLWAAELVCRDCSFMTKTTRITTTISDGRCGVSFAGKNNLLYLATAVRCAWGQPQESSDRRSNTAARFGEIAMWSEYLLNETVLLINGRPVDDEDEDENGDDGNMNAENCQVSAACGLIENLK